MSILVIIGCVIGTLVFGCVFDYLVTYLFGTKRPKAIDDLEKLSEYNY